MAKSVRKNYDEENIDSDSMMNNAPKKSGRSSYLTLPKSVTLFQPKADKPYRLIFIPWRAGSGNRSFPKGQLASNRFFEVHTYIGPDAAAFVCSKKTSGNPCKACEMFDELQKSGNHLKGQERKTYWENTLKQYKYKERELWLVHDIDGEPKNLQVWDESVRLFGDFLRSKMGLVGKRQKMYKDFAHPTRGSVLIVQGNTKAIGQQSCTEFSTIELEERDEELPDWIFDTIESLSVDSFLTKTPYDVQCRICGCTGESEDDDEGGSATQEGDEDDSEVDDAPPPRKRPAATPAKTPTKQETNGDVEEEEDEEPAPVRRPAAKAPASAPKAVEEDEDEEPEDDPTPPTRKSGKPAPKVVINEDGDDIVEEDDDDEETVETVPVKKKSGRR